MSLSVSNGQPDARRARRLILAIAALCFAPFVAALFAYFYLPQPASMNYGDLISVRPLIDPPLRHLDQRVTKLSALRGKWILLQLDDAECAAACRAKLYNMRQVRLAQGRDMERVERVWLILDDAPLATQLLREYDGTRMLRAGGSPLLAEFPATGNVRDHVYVIDPLGNLMLRFPVNAEAARMNRDLVRLLKVSRIG